MAQVCDILITCLSSPAESAEVLEAENGVFVGRKRAKSSLKYGSCDINFTMDFVWKEIELF